MWRRWQDLKLWKRVLIGLGLGIVTGTVLNLLHLEHYGDYIKPVGDIFLNLIRMLMVPLIFFSLVSGIIAMNDPTKMSRVGLKTIAIYMISTSFAVMIGLVLANLLEPGVGAILPDAAGGGGGGSTSILDMIVNMVPKNPVAAMAEGNVLQIIFFAIMFGLAINMAGEKAVPVWNLINSGSEVLFKLVHLIMEFAPYGVFALIAWVAATQGPAVFIDLAMIVLTLYIACFLQVALVYTGAIAFIARLSPKRFLQGIVDAQSVAFSTSTSAGTLPVTLSNVQDNLGVSKGISSFILPLGATINMDGTAIYMGIAAVFTAQAIGVDLSMAQYATIILTGTLASIGAASVPSAGLIIMPMVLLAVDLPLGAIALFAGVDRIMDMMRTATNITGDAMTAVLVAKSEGEINEEIFNAPPVE